MKWEDLVQPLAKHGLNLLASAVPGGAFVSGLVADVLKVNNNPQDISEALENASPEKVLELKTVQENNRNRLEEVILQENTKRIVAVNETMRAESKSEHVPQWLWRPVWGFVSAAAFFVVTTLCCMLAWKAVSLADANAMAMIPQIITTFTTLFSIPAAILGIASWHRGKEKRERVK